MSDSGIEKALEEDLQAAAPRLCLYVDGRLKESVPDTPSGRVRIDKVAMLWSESGKTVEVRKAAGGAHADDLSPRMGPEEPRTVPASGAPAALRPPAGCCTPKPAAGPSGVRLRHAWDCPRAPGEVFHSSVVDLSRARLSRNHLKETMRTGLEDSILRHPAQGTLSADGHVAWHPGESALDCIECSERGD